MSKAFLLLSIVVLICSGCSMTSTVITEYRNGPFSQRIETTIYKE